MKASSDPRLSWAAQVAQYPAADAPGVSYFRGELSSADRPGAYVDCLLYRLNSEIIGILNHYPQDLPPWEYAGSITVQVRDDHRRQGIGTALMYEAWSRWPFMGQQQVYTDDGLAFIKALLQKAAMKNV